MVPEICVLPPDWPLLYTVSLAPIICSRNNLKAFYCVETNDELYVLFRTDTVFFMTIQLEITVLLTQSSIQAISARDKHLCSKRLTFWFRLSRQ